MYCVKLFAANHLSIGIVHTKKYLAGKITGGFGSVLNTLKIFLRVRFLLLLWCLVPGCVLAQFTYVRDQAISVSDINGNAVAMPWAGGLNAAQYNTMDLNMDGKDDLVLFDRMANKVITFLNIDNEYRYAPEYESFFPEGITNWLVLRDFNCDGKKDIFTGDVLGIKVFENKTQNGGTLAWEQFKFFSGFPNEPKSEVLLTKGFTFKTNLQLQFDDLPAIVDVDGDGDLDILSMRFVGDGSVEYHKNFSMERYGTCDSLDFERVTQTWGDFKECDCNVFAFNGTNCPPNGGRVQHAGGKSLLFLDADGDSKPDLIFSEAECTRLFFLKNEGTAENPIINSAVNFPVTDPVGLLYYPAAFYEDVDFDGVKDLIASPNIFLRSTLMTNLERSNWFYKNTGTEVNPTFTFVKNNFLQEHMIDVGDNAIPAFFDFDADGDYDLFISQFTGTGSAATIKLYENIGTAAQPAFKLILDDYLGFSFVSFYDVKIQFADINSDGKIDLVFTGRSLQGGPTRLYYVLNKSNTILDFSGQQIQNANFSVFISENITVVDVNQDGLPDLLVGKNSGALEYWRNVGPEGVTSFVLEDAAYLGLGPSVLRQNLAVAVADLDGDRKADLVMGDQTGRLRIVSNFREASNAGNLVDIIFNPLRAQYETQNLGGRVWPTVVNLFNSTKPSLVVGNSLGGLQVLRHDEGESLPRTPRIELYPNPVASNDVLHIVIDRPAFVQLVTIMGQELDKPMRIQPNENFTYKIPNLSPGIYIVRFVINNQSFAKRIVVL